MEPVQFFQWLVDQEWYQAVTSIVAAAAVLAALTPNSTDNLILKWLKFVLDIVAFNVGHAKNAKK